MKQQWEKLAGKIDALSLRERGILLVVISFAIIFLFDSLLIAPQYAQQKILSDKIKQEQSQMNAIRIEIAQRVANVTSDPDALIKRRIASAQQQLAQIDSNLQTLQKNLVRPEKMSFLLENILKRNHQLQLTSLKNLPVINVLDEMEQGKESAGKPAAAAGGNAGGNTNTSTGLKITDANVNGAIYKHEVEIVVEGSYLDMLSYMRDLESLPEQVYWNAGKLTVIDYPKARLTLTLFTLSLEKKWLNL